MNNLLKIYEVEIFELKTQDDDANNSIPNNNNNMRSVLRAVNSLFQL